MGVVTILLSRENDSEINLEGKKLKLAEKCGRTRARKRVQMKKRSLTRGEFFNSQG